MPDGNAAAARNVANVGKKAQQKKASAPATTKIAGNKKASTKPTVEYLETQILVSYSPLYGRNFLPCSAQTLPLLSNKGTMVAVLLANMTTRRRMQGRMTRPTLGRVTLTKHRNGLLPVPRRPARRPLVWTTRSALTIRCIAVWMQRIRTMTVSMPIASPASTRGKWRELGHPGRVDVIIVVFLTKETDLLRFLICCPRLLHVPVYLFFFTDLSFDIMI